MSIEHTTPVEILMEDGTWEEGELLRDTRDKYGHAGLIRWSGIEVWLYRQRGKGLRNEWRYLTPQRS